jgi:transcriptional regulator with XRE-family HTH domain
VLPVRYALFVKPRMTRLDGSFAEQRSLDPALGRTIESARRKRGVTQVGLAATCGMSRRHLASIEAGANFSVAILLDLARALPDQVLPVGEFLLVRVPERTKSEARRVK